MRRFSIWSLVTLVMLYGTVRESRAQAFWAGGGFGGGFSVYPNSVISSLSYGSVGSYGYLGGYGGISLGAPSYGGYSGYYGGAYYRQTYVDMRPVVNVINRAVIVPSAAQQAAQQRYNYQRYQQRRMLSGLP